MKNRIEDKLRKNFQPKVLEIKNNSHLHSGHLGDNGSGETHFSVTIQSKDFDDVSVVNSHRKINAVLKEEFASGMHALEIKIIR